MSLKRSKPEFDYARRAADVEAARRTVREAFEGIRDRRDPADPGRTAWRAAVHRFNAAIEAAYPPGFWDDVDRLKRGDRAGLESAIRFLEADPFFFRSGYVKARLVRLVTRAPVERADVDRLRHVAIAAIDGRDRREFRSFCRLATFVDGPVLRSAVEARLGSPDSGVRRRAGWMRDALVQHARTVAGLRQIKTCTRNAVD